MTIVPMHAKAVARCVAICAPFSYGAWKAIKTIFLKRQKFVLDWEVYAILDYRFDSASTWSTSLETTIHSYFTS